MPSKVFAYELYPESQRQHAEVDAYLRKWHGVDPWYLARDLRMPERYIRARQRVLGLRKCVQYVPKAKR